MATSTTIYRDCEYCGTEFGQPDDPGRKRRFCSNACRQAAYRARVRGQRARQQRAREEAWRRAEEQARQAQEEAGRARREEERRRRQRARQDRQPPPHAGTSRPRSWCSACDGSRGPHTTHHDDAAHERARRRYEALCRKAAGTNFPHEAAACRVKAEELCAKYGL